MSLSLINRSNGNGKLDLLQRGSSLGELRVFTVSTGGGLDADASAFIEAAGITDETQQSAINTLVTDLKTYGIWTKMKAIYPFVGGTATSHKWNLKDPRDLDAAFRLTFSGGWTHSSTGALPNGSTGYANSWLSNNVMGMNDMHMSMYSRTNNGAQLRVDMGCANPADPSSGLHYNWPSLGCLSRINCDYRSGLYTPTITTRLMLTTSTELNRSLIYHEGILRATNTSTSRSAGIRYIYLGARNDSNTNVLIGSTAYYSNKEFAWASIGNGLTSTDVTNLNGVIEKFQTDLGRQV